MKKRHTLGHLAALLLAAGSQAAYGEPYLAVQMGLKCGQCHVNPTGAGLRNPYGNAYSQTVMPARRLIADDQERWTGMIGTRLLVGGNLRADFGRADVPDEDGDSEFDLQEARLFADFAVIPGRLSVYVDERVAPGNADNLEAHLRFWIREGALYVKAGRLYLPFGWRFEDDSSFLRQISGISMTTPDTGAELGIERGPWTAQFAVSNGAAGGPERDNGKLFSLRGEFVQSRWRAGASLSSNDSDAGDRYAFAVHAGLRTGPIAWLGEIDLIDDDSLGRSGRQHVAALGEANWLFRPGHNVKLTFEYLDPDEDLEEDEQNRTSLVYELTPVEFLQLRVGARVHDGIPQSPLQNRRQYFIQLHGYF